MDIPRVKRLIYCISNKSMLNKNFFKNGGFGNDFGWQGVEGDFWKNNLEPEVRRIFFLSTSTLFQTMENAKGKE